MKMFIFLLFIVVVVALVVRKTRRAQAEAALVRRQEVERRRKQAKEELTPELDMTWPVIIRPATGSEVSGAGTAVEEPSMTTIEYEPPERAAS